MLFRKKKPIRPTRVDTIFHSQVRRANEPMFAKLLEKRRKDIHDRALGCGFGLAVGDVIGCAVEGMSSRDIHRRYGAITGLVHPDYWRLWRLPGLHSDDTQQALATLDAAIKAVDQIGIEDIPALCDMAAEELAKTYVDGVRAVQDAPCGCWRGTGRGFRGVVKRLTARSKPKGWPYGCAAPSAGLGAAMRVPLLAFLPISNEALGAVVSAVTRITHSHPLAVTSATTVALACRLLTEQSEDSFVASTFLEKLRDQVRKTEHEPSIAAAFEDEGEAALMSDLVDLVATHIGATPKKALSLIAEMTGLDGGAPSSTLEGFGPSGVAACLFFFARAPLAPKEALLAVINAGGDTDTTGSIVGALAGSLHGPNAFDGLAQDVVGLELVIDRVGAAFGDQKAAGLDLVAEETWLSNVENEFRGALRARR